MHLLCLLLCASGCGLAGGAPEGGELPAAPDRQIAPWRPEALEVCVGARCGPEQAARVDGADVRVDEGRWLVLAAIDGALHEGELLPGWRLLVEEEPVLAPSRPWQAAGLVDPDWVQAPGGATVLYGLADGSALGAARVEDGRLVDAEQPLLTAAAAGATRVSGPTAVTHGGRVLLAFAADEARLQLASGPDLEALAAPRPLFEAGALSTGGWSDVGSVTAPELALTGDGVVGLFFAARGKTAADRAADFSVGFAGSSDGERFESFAANPVYDRTYGFIFCADEHAPAVALGRRPAVMLYRDDASQGARLALAVHDG